MTTFELHHGKCLDVLRGLADCSVDSVVTDPPYGLSDHRPEDVRACLSAWVAGIPYEPKGKGFMGKEWDAWVPGPEVWRECLRVLKPGGHLLAFAGTRSMDLMSMAVRLAGFELRDAIGWANDGGGAPLLAWAYGSGFPKSHNGPWGGTALKPAWEPIILARKPLAGTVEANWCEHGTGALNIEGCRVGGEVVGWGGARGGSDDSSQSGGRNYRLGEGDARPVEGRWPANLIHDGSDEVLAAFPSEAGGQDMRQGQPPGVRPGGFCNVGSDSGSGAPNGRLYGDTGSAARFFYCAKADKSDRDAGLHEFAKASGGFVSNTSGQHMTRRDEGYEVAPRANNHPTVKPTDLMRYLCRLVTPPGGTVLDPYNGSGSTGKGAVLEGFHYIGIDREAEYIAIARARIEHAVLLARSGAEVLKPATDRDPHTVDLFA